MNPPKKSIVLIVDDSPTARETLSVSLETEGYDLQEASNGFEALQKAAAIHPDVILLDVMMPEINGFEVCRRLRADPVLAEIPILLITALDDRASRLAGLEAGADDFITKPFDRSELRVRLRTVTKLNRYHKLREEHARLERAVAELEELSHAYFRYVPQEFLRFLGKSDIREIRKGDQVQMTMAVMFSDIRSFSTISERMTPEEAFHFIDDYLAAVAPQVRSHGGIIDKYMGDGIMALFPQGASAALRAALQMLSALDAFNAELRQSDQSPVRIGIGIHSGPMTLGVVGERERLSTTVISEAVNLTSRLEGMTKNYNASIVLSEDALRQVAPEDLTDEPGVFPERPFQRFLDTVQVRGLSSTVNIYEVIRNEPGAKEKVSASGEFAQAVGLYHSQGPSAAAPSFQALSVRCPQDKAIAHYLAKCAREVRSSRESSSEAVGVLSPRGLSE